MSYSENKHVITDSIPNTPPSSISTDRDLLKQTIVGHMDTAFTQAGIPVSKVSEVVFSHAADMIIESLFFEVARVRTIAVQSEANHRSTIEDQNREYIRQMAYLNETAQAISASLTSIADSQSSILERIYGDIKP